MAAECEDADRLDRGPTHSLRPHIRTCTHTHVISHSLGSAAENSLKSRISLLFLGEVFFSHSFFIWRRHFVNT